ncbi:hypothetical protein CYMTET_33930 [Cymbomonas tetramitiformis]|uniref:Uncharacterized protein n=1 Tax=Cymbomonas tetramitiformis TaxID=36881 RepID=A0AAE0FCQ4_9CHLO|nr:hypothetical protein CYMTET_33930 [Cymbomonas tetramitiformis]
MSGSHATCKCKTDVLNDYRSKIAEYCTSDFSCGCSAACHKQVNFKSYENNYKHIKKMLSQKEYAAAITAAISAAVVVHIETGKRHVLEGESALPNTHVFQEPPQEKPDDTSQYEAFKDWASVHLIKGLAQDMPTNGAKQITPIDFSLEYGMYKKMVHPDALERVPGILRLRPKSSLRSVWGRGAAQLAFDDALGNGVALVLAGHLVDKRRRIGIGPAPRCASSTEGH